MISALCKRWHCITYQDARKKTTLRPIFRQVVIRRPQILGIGNIIMHRSTKTLVSAVAKKRVFVGPHFPPRNGFHDAATGVQLKKEPKKDPISAKIFRANVANIARLNVRELLALGKRRW